MSATHHRSCNLCEAMCGLVITHDDTRVLDIRGDKDDPLSQGHICPKAFALRDLHEDGDRLRTPLRRTDSGWQDIGWDEAFDLVTSELRAVQARHGQDAVAVYQGNPSVHNLGTMLMSPHMVRSLRTRNRYSATSVDQLPHHFVGYYLFGHQFMLPVPDVDRTQHMLVLGANPIVSNGSIMSAPGMRRRLNQLRERGGQLVVVDPRRSETAARADAHHFIRPGTDAMLLAALIHRVFATCGPRLRHLAEHVAGLDALAEAVARFPAARVAQAVGIDAPAIEAMADAVTAADSAVVYGRMGVCTAEFGALGMWLVTALNLVTGNLDRPGGMMFASPAVDVLARTSRGGHDRWRSRVRDLPEFGGELPVAALAEEIDTPGPGQVRGLVTSAGNPVLSTPNGKRLGAALGQLEFMVSVDPYLNETTRHAHVILPPKIGLEVPHYDLIFHGLAVRNTARFADALFPGHDNARTDAEIFAALARRLGPGGKVSTLGKLERRATLAMSPTQQLDMALRRGPYGKWSGRLLRGDGLSVALLRGEPHGVDLGPLRPQLPEGIRAKGGVLQLAPALILRDFDRLDTALRREDGRARSRRDPDPPVGDPGRAHPLRLIGRRSLQDHNSWLHNAATLMKGRPRCVLHMHPDDAERRGLSAGQRVRLSSRVGAVEVPVHLTDQMMPGVVSLPHGWGHTADDTRQTLASASPGVSINDVTDAALLDQLSGNAALSGVPVQVAGV